MSIPKLQAVVEKNTKKRTLKRNAVDSDDETEIQEGEAEEGEAKESDGDDDMEEDGPASEG